MKDLVGFAQTAKHRFQATAIHVQNAVIVMIGKWKHELRFNLVSAVTMPMAVWMLVLSIETCLDKP